MVLNIRDIESIPSKDVSVVDDVVYNQYLLIDGKLEPLGNTSTDISNVYLKDEVDSKFALLSNLQTLIDMVGNASDLETTVKDTLVNAINEIKEGLDNCITKDAIVTTIDDTVTDDQVPSAKVVYDKLQEVFQSSNDTQNAYETAIIGKGGTVSKASNVATKREILDGIESISVGEGEDIAPIHDTMTDLGYNATNLTNLSVDKTAHIISKWFILKSTTDNVDTILDVANTDDTDTFTDWITDDEITDFGDYINPTYSATQLTVSEDTTSGMFVSEELTVDELCAVNEGEVN